MKPFGLAIVALGTALAMIFAGAAPLAPSTAPASQPAKEMTLDLGGKVTLKLVRIPAGKFMMGSPETEKGRDTDEVQHEVTISKPFYMGITHVTVDQFAAFAKDSGYKTDAEKEGQSWAIEIKDGKFSVSMVAGCSWCNPSFEQKGNHPVVQVSWDDATAFCNWLSKKSGKTVGLRTEAQWEYACRAGTKTAYTWGDNPDDGKDWANCADQSLKQKLPNMSVITHFSWNDGFVFTSPVASFKPNAFGLYDMMGNAWQWCQDSYGAYDKGVDTDPTGAGAATGDLRVMRGGSWIDGQWICRSASRSRFDIGYRYRCDYYGVRVAVAGGE